MTVCATRVLLNRSTLRACMVGACLYGAATAAPAQDATWATVPSSGDVDNPANWSPATVPSGTAAFGASTISAVSFGTTRSLGTLAFNTGAPGYSFTIGSFMIGVTLTDRGIVNDAGTVPSFLLTGGGGSLTFTNAGSAANAVFQLNDGNLGFIDTSSAARATILNAGGNVMFGNPGLHENHASTAANAVIVNSSSGVTALTQFASHATAGNATIVNGATGVTLFLESSTAGTASITNGNGGRLEFGGSGSIPAPGAPSADHAVIVNNDAGRTTFSTAGNGYTSTAGNATIIDNSGGSTAFSGNSTGGNARFINNIGGVFDMSGLGPDGMTAGSIEGAGAFYVGGKTLAVGTNNLTTEVSGIIADGGAAVPSATGGALTKVGSGALLLSGANTYTGVTTVNAGTLNVEGSIAASSQTIVNADAVLRGSGVVGNATINRGSTFAPGNGTPNSSMTVVGSLAFESGAAYLVQVNPSTASFVHVTGAATLGGATVNAVFANGNYLSKSYTILNADGGVYGSFSPNVVNTNLPANFHATLSYDARAAYLNLVLNFAIPGLNANQQAVSSALTNDFNRNGSIPLVYGALGAAGLTQASGELATASQQTTFDAMGQFMGLLTDPFMQRGLNSIAPGTTTGFAEASHANDHAASGHADAFAMLAKAPPPGFEQRWRVWAAGFGGSQSTAGNAVTGSNTARSDIYGTAAGADYLVTPNTLAGFALAGGGTGFAVNGSGFGRSDLFQAGAYMRHASGPAYVSAAVAYGWQDVTTDRSVTAAGADRLRAKFNANAYSGRIEGGYGLAPHWPDGIGFTPYAAAQFVTVDLPGYAEQVISGTPAFALSYAAKNVTDARSELGLRASRSLALPDGVVTLRGRLAWAHDFAPDRAIAATFIALPGASFVVNGAAQAHDSALTTASAEVQWRNGWSAAAAFEGEFSEVTRSYAGKGVLRYQW